MNIIAVCNILSYLCVNYVNTSINPEQNVRQEGYAFDSQKGLSYGFKMAQLHRDCTDEYADVCYFIFILTDIGPFWEIGESEDCGFQSGARRFETWSCQTKDFKMYTCRF